ncbi:MAG: hypothetical protein VX589_02940 [Myxococcota bacterium]|nr:hypothetical protein [Myxococcota bacterium]
MKNPTFRVWLRGSAGGRLRLSAATALLMMIGCGTSDSSDEDALRLADEPLPATMSAPTSMNAGGAMAQLNDDDHSNTAMMDDPEPVEATLRILNPGAFGNSGYSNVTVTSSLGSAVTDTNGSATVSVTSGPYAIKLTAGNARPHTVFGVSAKTPFTQITYMSPEMITGFVFGQLGLMDDRTKGILVVGLDTPTLAPAVAASATIDAASGTPFVFAGMAPVSGNAIPANGQGFVTFPNVTPGTVTIEALMPDGRCAIFPAETGAASVVITAGEVSVVAYTCRQNTTDQP